MPSTCRRRYRRRFRANRSRWSVPSFDVVRDFSSHRLPLVVHRGMSLSLRRRWHHSVPSLSVEARIHAALLPRTDGSRTTFNFIVWNNTFAQARRSASFERRIRSNRRRAGNMHQGNTIAVSRRTGGRSRGEIAGVCVAEEQTRTLQTRSIQGAMSTSLRVGC